jgi:hypothetical protein
VFAACVCVVAAVLRRQGYAGSIDTGQRHWSSTVPSKAVLWTCSPWIVRMVTQKLPSSTRRENGLREITFSRLCGQYGSEQSVETVRIHSFLSGRADTVCLLVGAATSTLSPTSKSRCLYLTPGLPTQLSSLHLSKAPSPPLFARLDP